MVSSRYDVPIRQDYVSVFAVSINTFKKSATKLNPGKLDFSADLFDKVRIVFYMR